MVMKICTVCQNLTAAFSPDKRASDGLQSCCKPCKNRSRLGKHPKKTREQARRHDIQWQINNPGKKAAYLAKRHAAKMQRTPRWLTSEQMAEIQVNYVVAKELSWLSEVPLQVDHIVPLQGQSVSGLHVPWNLQVIPADINQRKGNRT